MNKDHGFRLLKDKDGYYCVAFHDERDDKWYKPELVNSKVEIDISQYKIIEDDVDSNGFVRFNRPNWHCGWYIVTHVDGKKSIARWDYAAGAWVTIMRHYDNILIDDEPKCVISQISNTVVLYKPLTDEMIDKL